MTPYEELIDIIMRALTHAWDQDTAQILTYLGGPANREALAELIAAAIIADKWPRS